MLSLVRFRPDFPRLARLGARYRLLPPGGEMGYVLHASLTARFGSSAPRPFVLRNTKSGHEVLGYSSLCPDEVRSLAALPCSGGGSEFAEALCAGGIEVKSMPECWRSGQRLGFTVRVRPVVRVHGERDVYVQRCLLLGSGGVLPSRESVYVEWLSGLLARDGAAQVVSCGMVSFCISRVLRRPADGNGRSTMMVGGPDVVLSGDLIVGDPEAFMRVLSTGIGRHRGFGFGMLLLAPPGSRSLC